MKIKNFNVFLLCFILIKIQIYSYTQTNPQAYILIDSAYHFDGFKDSTSTTYPTSMQGWAFDSEPISPIEQPACKDTSLAPKNTAVTIGSIRNEGENGISFLNSGNKHIGALVIALNTEHCKNIKLEWIAQEINSQNRSNGLVAQYRIGNQGNYTTINGSTYLSDTLSENTAPLKHFKNIMLPDSTFNKPLVQIRWLYYLNYGSGSRDRIRLNHIHIQCDSIVKDSITTEDDTISQDSCTTIISNFPIQNLKIYPIPVKDILNIENIENKISEIIIRDVNARALIHILSPHEQERISCNILQKGMYILEIKEDSQIKKFYKILKL